MILPIDLTLPWQVAEGDCLEVMAKLPEACFDAVVTDPPYGIAFMGKAWDHGVPGVPFWAEALRVARPGAHLLAFGGTRTFHRLTCAIEDAGWEIRDCLSWLYASGFPKSHNGPWGGTALKPAWEPVVVARKPLIGTVAANHAAHGTGGLKIDATRISFVSSEDKAAAAAAQRTSHTGLNGTSTFQRTGDVEASIAGYVERMDKGRWPANVVLDEDAAAMLDADSGTLQSGEPMGVKTGGKGNAYGHLGGGIPVTGYGDSGGASRFFYTAKASRGEREAGLSGRATAQRDETRDPDAPGGNNPRNRGAQKVRNTHPTVKPVDLMRWLVRLVTPVGGLVLDPFAGSGTTGIAANAEGCRALLIEREAGFVNIARARIKHWSAQASLPLVGGA